MEKHVLSRGRRIAGGGLGVKANMSHPAVAAWIWVQIRIFTETREGRAESGLAFSPRSFAI